MIFTIAALTACGGKAATDKSSASASKKVDFPKKAVTLIVPYAAGGGTDSTARALAKAAEKHLGQAVTVVNKTGGGGSVGMTEGANSKPDGYTVTMATVELTTLPHLGLSPITYENFKPVALVNYDPAAITVRADSQWKTMKEFLDYAKAHPGELKLGNSGTGAIWHLGAVTLEKGAGVKFNHIPFEGAGPAITALLGGHVDAVPVSAAEVKAQVDTGKLRALAINDSKPSAALPGVKTLKEETGLTVEVPGTWRGIAVPKDTPDEIVSILTDAFTKGASDQEFKDYMGKNGLGIEIKDAKSFGQHLKNNHDQFGKLIPELGLGKK
ncbi:tripartite tricarboxylate transporter substrate binding protein [Paenibacillus piri]|uniref:Tripartite tricarboxylate transporter substrate binding protein n=2 Tax=Paenibacillus piri TaxID=2547395 RepID=A0A4R5KGH7_9BACL|nr:tripartite tricarboxylate transporter substrate binding protein [Paenibacillus piri]